ncbi:MAG TPA: hypothetical protein VGR32_12210 [Brevundimonas sp.]|jgi:hypothetical protein|uniref:hypothetical protein n=1 Tax=Brevundimonas sp. TaxID=1871086 RepID=UPI002DE61E8E|nr:hypothetical protein [Brevundimonas sp.]
MLKSMFVGAAALMLSAGAAAADEWEAIAISDSAVMAVDWGSMRINGNMRQINTALVAVQAEAGQFDWATSLVDVDCSQSRYKTVRSSFFYIDGSSASEDFVGDGSWTSINPGALMDDVRGQVCAAAPGKQGYFDDPLTFAVNARRVMQEQ